MSTRIIAQKDATEMTVIKVRGRLRRRPRRANSREDRHERLRRIRLACTSWGVITCGAESAPGVARWLGDTPRRAVADVLGYEELGGEDAVETTIIEAWGDG
jgi:hypothetical protein